MFFSGLRTVNIETKLTETRGKSAGFDYLRIVLAVAVIFFHSRPTMLGGSPHDNAVAFTSSGGDQAGLSIFNLLHALAQPLEWMILPGFFALSGFLVSASLLRSKTTLEFGLLRVLRIVPALFFETLAFAFIVGPIVTEFPLSKYFSSPVLWSYPLNIIGYIHYELPGVFLHNPRPLTVNSQLWTIPAEFDCYTILILASLTKITRYRNALPIVMVSAVAVALASQILTPWGPPLWSEGGGRPSEVTLVLCFLAGVTLFSYRAWTPLHPALFVLSLLAVYGAMWNGALQYLAGIPAAYAIVYIGFSVVNPSFLSWTADLSYGIFLYGFPIQQLFALWFPGFRQHWLIVGFVGPLLVSTAIAAVSWFALELPIAEKRKKIIAVCQVKFDALISRVPRKWFAAAESANR